MAASDQQENNIIKDLGGGLVLRRGVPADGQQLSTFNARLHMEDDADKPDERINQWTHDLMVRPHPTTSAADFTIVEDLNTKQIVSTLVLISQTWSFAGIEFKVGRPELGGTVSAYRERGLVRAQIDAIHEWSCERGELVQAITGIPYYYRQFGYEMGMELGGGRVGFIQQIPDLMAQAPFTLRLVLDRGRLATIEEWNPEPDRICGDAGFPGLTFCSWYSGTAAWMNLNMHMQTAGRKVSRLQ